MIRRLTKADEASVLEFLYLEPEINLYIIGDIKNFGFDQTDQAIYAEFVDGAYYAVMSRNLSHIVYYAKSPLFNPDWLPIMNQFDYLFISGKAPLLKAMAPYFKALTMDRLEFMKSTSFIKDETVDYSHIKTLSNEDDALKVYRLLNQIDELESVKQKSQEEFITYLLDNSGDNGTTVFIEKDGQAIASASAVGETKKTAMIVGVATHKDYRKQGYGKTVLHKLVDLYVNQKNKTLCLYYDDPRAGALYEQMGFVPLDEWIMLIKTDD
jgi:predicted GNAT family acetyltransferase